MTDENKTVVSDGTPTPQPDANQKPAPGGKDNPENKQTEEMVSKVKFDEAVGSRQAAKDRARKAEASSAEMKKLLDAMPSSEQLDAFNVWNTDKAAQERDKAIKANDVDAIEKGVREPLEAQIKSLTGRTDTLKAQLTSLLCDNALRTAAVEAGAHNPDQVVSLLRARVRMDENETGQFVPDYRDAEGQPLYDGASQRVADAKVFVGLYLAQADNANLVKAQANPGSGARPPGGGPPPTEGKIPTTRAEFDALTPDARKAVASKMTADQRKALMGIESTSGETWM